MKPLNLDNSPCSPISSNCVIWQGPDIECIKLCKGDTVSDVVYKLATELCTILDTLDIKNYDLSCFNLTSCAPADFQALINFLIERICALENIPSTGSNVLGGSGCPTDCLVEVIPCLATSPNQVLNLIDYVNLIATRVCNIATSVGILQTTVVNIQNQVTALQTTVSGLSNYTTPTFAIGCDIGTLTEPTSYPINEILQQFINSVWCPMNVALVGVGGSASNLTNAVASQCTLGTDIALVNQFSSPTTIAIQYAGSWVSPATSVADAIRNLWIVLCDVRNAEVMSYQVTASNDITVTTSVVGPLTTFNIGRAPKINFYEEFESTVDVVTDPGFVNLTYFSPLGYNILSFTNTTGVVKDFVAHVSSDSEAFRNIGGPSVILSNWVDTALVLNPATVLYQSNARPSIDYNLWDTVTNDAIDGTTPERVLTDPSGNPVTLSIADKATIPFNTAFFKKVTLNPGQSITVMFRSRVGESGRLLKAQLLVQEI
jgi:hypothetical protein